MFLLSGGAFQSCRRLIKEDLIPSSSKRKGKKYDSKHYLRCYSSSSLVSNKSIVGVAGPIFLKNKGQKKEQVRSPIKLRSKSLKSEISNPIIHKQNTKIEQRKHGQLESLAETYFTKKISSYNQKCQKYQIDLSQKVTTNSNPHKNPISSKAQGLRTKTMTQTQTGKKQYLCIDSRTLVEYGKTVSSYNSQNSQCPHSSTVVFKYNSEGEPKVSPFKIFWKLEQELKNE